MLLSGRRPEAKIRLKPDCSLADRRSVEGAPQFGALAETAAGLTQQMQAHLVWMARTLADRWVALDRKFRKRLKELGYSAAQAASLVEITPGAAGQMLAAGRSLSEFLEQVQYRGRRLAKLDLAPAQVVAALREFDLLLDQEGASRFGSRDADLRWARNQLHFLVVLTLNDAYYVVREAESQTFYGLFRAQTESRSLDALWERSLRILTAFSGASEAGIFVCQPDGTWVAAAGLPDWKGEAAEVARAALDLGFDISFSGILTFKNAADLREVARFVPLDRCLIETDSPYLAPVPHRGKTNTPALVPYVAAQLAELKGLSVEAVAEATSANFDRLFTRARRERTPCMTSEST
jgi:hypothetical protein